MTITHALLILGAIHIAPHLDRQRANLYGATFMILAVISVFTT